MWKALGVSRQYLQRLFRRTDFKPALIIHQRSFYLSYDWEAWQDRYWKYGKFQMEELTTAA